MAHKLKFAALAVLMSTTALPSYPYGGEDFIDGLPWHHHDMTMRATAGDATAYNAATKRGFETIFPGTGFSEGAARAVAWHADYIDSYIYNPLFWAQGGMDDQRTRAALSHYGDLIKLHHDDTFTVHGLEDNWERYLGGAVLALYWAAENNDRDAAHMILGMTLHSVQDFYTHSNWMDDPARRLKTWHDYTPRDRANMRLYTGTYELPETIGPHHHGSYGFACGTLNKQPVKSTIEAICGGVSPFSSTGVCVEYNSCKEGTPVPVSVLGMNENDASQPGFKTEMLWANPQGINLDSVRLTQIGAKTRGITDAQGSYRPGMSSTRMSENQCKSVVNYGVTCGFPLVGNGAETCERNRGYELSACADRDTDYLFAQSKYLAIKSSQQVLALLEQAMNSMGKGQFWNAVKSGDSTGTNKAELTSRAEQVELFRNIYFQFMTVGEYPIQNPSFSNHPTISTSDGWYMRTRIKTSNDNLSGTDADILAIVSYKKSNGQTGKKTFKLDYLPRDDREGRTRNPLLVYNDFEAGRDDVYTFGPIPGEPLSVELKNSAAGGSDIAKAAWSDIKIVAHDVVETLANLAKSIIGGADDYIGTTKKYYTSQELAGMTSNGARSMTLAVNNDTEGKYDLNLTLAKISNANGVARYRITLNSLKCRMESKVDGASRTDEPYLFFTAVNINGRKELDQEMKGYWGGPYEDIDTGDTKTFTSAASGRTYDFDVDELGGLTMAFQMWESDQDNEAKRRTRWNTFRSGVSEDAQKQSKTLLDALASASFSDWKVDKVTAIAFYRGGNLKVKHNSKGAMSGATGWVDGGESRTFSFGPAPVKDLTASAGLAKVSEWQALPRTDWNDPIRAGQAAKVILDARDKSRPVLNGTQTVTIAPKQESPIVLGPKLQLMTPVWQGSWNTNFGQLRLHQTGSKVTGDYGNVGKIDAIYDASTSMLTGTFTNNGRTGFLRLKFDADKFSGEWGWGTSGAAQGSWTGNKTSSEKPALRN